MILDLLHAAARGTFPPEDGVTQVVGAAAGAGAAVLSFTAHHVVAADIPAGEVHAVVDPTNVNGPVAPEVLRGSPSARACALAQVASANAASLRAPARRLRRGRRRGFVRSERGLPSPYRRRGARLLVGERQLRLGGEARFRPRGLSTYELLGIEPSNS